MDGGVATAAERRQQMGESNILSGGVEVLTQMREALSSLEEMKRRNSELDSSEAKLKTDIEMKKKIIADEISLTVKKRQEEVEESFDGQIDKTRARLKKVKGNRDKAKDARVSERIKFETAGVVEEKRKFRQDLKELFKVNQIPRIFNTQLFFSWFVPGEFRDYLIDVASIIVLAAIPTIVNLFLPESVKTVFLTIIMYIAVFGIVGLIYFAIFRNVRDKHIDALKEARRIRNRIRRNEKTADVMSKNIKQDPDESRYNLNEFDDEIAELEKQILSISEQKKEALTVFENQTKLDIANDITARHNEELENLQNAYNAAYTESKQLSEQINASVLEISGKYEAYLGKENLQISKIDGLIEIINTGDALNIADALIVYDKRMEAAKETK